MTRAGHVCRIFRINCLIAHFTPASFIGLQFVYEKAQVRNLVSSKSGKGSFLSCHKSSLDFHWALRLLFSYQCFLGLAWQCFYSFKCLHLRHPNWPRDRYGQMRGREVRCYVWSGQPNHSAPVEALRQTKKCRFTAGYANRGSAHQEDIPLPLGLTGKPFYPPSEQLTHKEWLNIKPHCCTIIQHPMPDVPPCLSCFLLSHIHK